MSVVKYNDMNIVLYNLYKKSRKHPFLFAGDYCAMLDAGMQHYWTSNKDDYANWDSLNITYPTYDGNSFTTKEECAKMYCEEHNALALLMQKTYPDNFRIFKSDVVRNDLSAIYKFLESPMKNV